MREVREKRTEWLGGELRQVVEEEELYIEKELSGWRKEELEIDIHICIYMREKKW